MWGVWLQGFNATTAFLLPDPFTPRQAFMESFNATTAFLLPDPFTPRQAFMESFNATTAFLLPRWLAKMRWSN